MTTSSDRTSSASVTETEEGPAKQDRSAGGASRSALLHLLLNLAMLVIFAFLFVVAGDLPDSAWEPLGAWAFPRFVLGALILLNLAMIGQNLPGAVKEVQARHGEMAGIVATGVAEKKLVILMLALFGVYVAAFGLVGYAVATFLFIVIAQFAVGPKTLANGVTAVIIALVASVGVEYFFARALSVFLPGGFF
ncbi:tripartite tricarboxylate transporter TctB family protein [Fodinicurvata sediminis]|uniref:tripartite tricarboxylate transporter TctB family protein n=1 Tax=Fodinicurvata sediminis TaxID=1121832 RepID=UPI0003B45840|nr:tripartite tricarboxylate transporter TctB family protein [Fodinicurvata sediminis]